MSNRELAKDIFQLCWYGRNNLVLASITLAKITEILDALEQRSKATPCKHEAKDRLTLMLANGSEVKACPVCLRLTSIMGPSITIEPEKKRGK